MKKRLQRFKPGQEEHIVMSSIFFVDISPSCHSSNAVRASQMPWSNVETTCKRSSVQTLSKDAGNLPAPIEVWALCSGR